MFTPEFYCPISEVFSKVVIIICIIIIIIIIPCDFFFSHQLQLMVFQGVLGDSKSLQISKTLLSIRADLNNAVVWMVSIVPLI